MASRSRDLNVRKMNHTTSSVIDAQWSVQMMERFANTVFRPSLLDLGEFFEALAKVTHELFRPSVVRIWDNNVHAKCLILIASYPHFEMQGLHNVIGRNESLTGIAIEQCDLIHIPDVRHGPAARFLQNQPLAESLRLRHLVSIPVFNPIDTQLVSFVVDLFYDEDVAEDFFRDAGPFRDHKAIGWLTSALGRSLDYLLYRITDDATRAVEQASSSSAGLSGFFTSIFPSLKRYASCTGAGIYRFANESNRLELECSAGDLSRDEINLLDPQNCLYNRAFRKGHSLMLTRATQADSIPKPLLMATPILSSVTASLGVLCATRGDSRGFSTMDLHILDGFARAISPVLERFIRVRESTFLVQATKQMSESVVGSQDLYAILQRTLDAVVHTLNADVGTIYLLERGSYPPRFVLRAATDRYKSLIGQASYGLREGITGTIAEGQVVNFTTREESTKHPNWIGKYDEKVWPFQKAAASDTLLGVPIQIEDRTIGVWKVENVRPSANHPDSYFTDEDTQLLRVLSAFLAYLIEHNWYSEFIKGAFRQLAHSSVEIESARTEDDAVVAVLAAVERAGFSGTRLWLYDDVKGRLREAVNTSGERYGEANQQGLLEVLTAPEPKAVQEGTGVRYSIGLRLDREPLGILEISAKHRAVIEDDEILLLKAFAAHIAVSLARLRSAQQALNLTHEALRSSRFATAEALSTLAVHSVRHRIRQIMTYLDDELRKPSVRERRELIEPFRAWQKKLSEMMQDLNNALQVVKSQDESTGGQFVDAHSTVKDTIALWHAFLRDHKCDIRHEFGAAHAHCGITVPALKEIISVMMVNSVQAHAHSITIDTFNGRDLETPGNYIQLAWCMDFWDDGDGLSCDDPDKIFEPSYTTKPENTGTGLGLFVARRLARDAGGELAVVRFKKGRGVTLRLMLPAEEKDDL